MFHIHAVDSEEVLRIALAIRHQVFVEEQGVDERLECDEHDRIVVGTFHILAWCAGEPVGTARLRLLDGSRAKLERFAVKRAWRGRGCGARMVQHCESVARNYGLSGLELHAQDLARGFYERLGFETLDEPFDEAGIPHVRMRKRLASSA